MKQCHSSNKCIFLSDPYKWATQHMSFQGVEKIRLLKLCQLDSLCTKMNFFRSKNEFSVKIRKKNPELSCENRITHNLDQFPYKKQKWTIFHTKTVWKRNLSRWIPSPPTFCVMYSRPKTYFFALIWNEFEVTD